MKHFQYLGKMLSYICCFIYRREVSKSPIGHHSYKWSKALFVSNLFVHCILYIYTYYNFSNNFKVEINNLTKFIVFSTYVGLRFVFAFLEQDPFTDLIFEIEMYDLQKKVLFYQHKSLHNKYYGKRVVSKFLFIVILVFFYYIVGVFFSYTNVKIVDRIILFTAIVIFNISSLPFTVLFVYFAYEIFLRYKRLHTLFRNELNSVNKNCYEQFLDNYRLLFFQLSRVQYKFSICFGSGTTLFYCYTYFLLLCLMRDALVTYHYPLILFFIVKVFLEMYLIASVAGNITKEVNLLLLTKKLIYIVL